MNCRATIVQHQSGQGLKSGKVTTESVAKPAIVRAADGNNRRYHLALHVPRLSLSISIFSSIFMIFMIFLFLLFYDFVCYLVPHTYGVGQMQAPQLPTVQGQATIAHSPPMVRILHYFHLSFHSIDLSMFFSFFFFFCTFKFFISLCFTTVQVVGIDR